MKRSSNPRPTNPAGPPDQVSERLVLRCQLGDLDAIDELVERWHTPLWRYVLAVTGDPDHGEEILQDAWLRILRSLDRLEDPQRLRAWIFTIVRRTFLDHLRTRYRTPDHAPLDDRADLASEEPAFSWEETADLHRALLALAPIDRDAVTLFYLRGLDLREVSEVLSVPAGTVKSRLHRARRTLRSNLEPTTNSRS